jgi:hypothetical protein
VNAIRGRRRIVPNRNLWRGVITFVIFVAGAALFSPKLWNHGIVNEFILPHAGIAVFALLIIAMSVSSTSARIRKSWEQNMWLQLPKSADISVDGVTQSDSASRSAWQWTGFIRAEESKNLFVFFISPSNFLVIPKRAFESEEQIAAMRAMMRLADGNRTGGFPVNLPPPMADK